MDDTPKIGEILVRVGSIDEFQLRAALTQQQRWGGRLGSCLVKLGFIEERELVRALASQLSIPIARLEGKKIQDSILELVPADFAERRMCLPLFVNEDETSRTLYVAMEDPCDLSVLDDLSFRTGMTVKPVMVGPSELCEAIDRSYRTDARRADARADGEGAISFTTPIEISLGQDTLADAGSLGAGAGPQSAPAAASPRPAPAPSSQESELEEGYSRDMVLALTQLLLEKGLIGLEELRDKVRAQRGLEAFD